MPYRLLNIEKRVRWWSEAELRRRWRSIRPLAAVAVLAARVGLWDGLLWPALRPRSAGRAREAERMASHAIRAPVLVALIGG